MSTPWLLNWEKIRRKIMTDAAPCLYFSENTPLASAMVSSISAGCIRLLCEDLRK